MQKVLVKTMAYRGSVFRNIRFPANYQVFDDLSHNIDARKFAFASSLSDTEKTINNDHQYNAIDYIFQRPSWEPSRFTDGTFPTWYGSVELETTFHESAFHWYRKYISAPDGFSRHDKPITARRSVYSVSCEAILIDFRNKTKAIPELIGKELSSYVTTQPLGKTIRDQGIPGIISPSARYSSGKNIIIFRPESLSNASYDKDYLYIQEPDNPTIIVKEEKSNKRIVEVNISL